VLELRESIVQLSLRLGREFTLPIGIHISYGGRAIKVPVPQSQSIMEL
jgi:hypothetical protein